MTAEEKTGNSGEQTTEAPGYPDAKRNESSAEQQTELPPSAQQASDGSAAVDQQVNRQANTLYLHTIIKISVAVSYRDSNCRSLKA